MIRSLLLFLFSLSVSLLAGQVCDFPLPPANTCQNAPLLCDLDGYCSNNGAAQNSGTPNAFCGVVENNNWVKFIAGSAMFEIEITVENCNNGSGLQAQFFETSNCQTFTSVSNCLDPVNGTSYLTASNLQIGQVYYLMMDGKGGDVCDYSYVITQGNILSPAEAVIEDPGYLCEDETLTLDGSASGSNGSALSYLWSSPDGNIIGDITDPLVSTDTPGTYQIYVEDQGGCTDSTSIEIIPSPLAEISINEPDTLDCLTNLSITLFGEEVTGIQDVEYLWSTQNGNIVSGENTQTPMIDDPGVYTLVITNSLTGCTEEASVEVFTSVSTPVADAGLDQELNCLNPTVALNGSGSSTGLNFTYQWSTGSGNILSGTNTYQAIVDQPGSYTLEVTNLDNDCVDQDEVIVIDNPAIPESALFTIKNPCYDEPHGSIFIDSVIGGTAPYLFAIDSTAFTSQQDFIALEPNSYQITIQDETGCEWDTTIMIEQQAELVVDLGEDELIQLGCPNEVEALINFPLSQVDTFIWRLWQSPANCPGCVTQYDTLMRTTEYAVTVVDQNGCTDTDTKMVYIEKERLIFIPNIFTPNDDGLNDIFMIHGGKDVKQVLSFKVFNRWGASLFEQTNFQPNDRAHSWNGQLQSSDMPTGVYVYLVEVEFIDGEVELYKGSFNLVR